MSTTSSFYFYFICPSFFSFLSSLFLSSFPFLAFAFFDWFLYGPIPHCAVRNHVPEARSGNGKTRRPFFFFFFSFSVKCADARRPRLDICRFSFSRLERLRFSCFYFFWPVNHATVGPVSQANGKRNFCDKLFLGFPLDSFSCSDGQGGRTAALEADERTTTRAVEGQTRGDNNN